MRTTAAWIYIAVSLVVIGFQFALAGGAPWGEYTMGGANRGQLPSSMRAVAVGSAVLLIFFNVVVAARAGIAFPGWLRSSRRLIWVVVIYGVVGVVLNAVTQSSRERMVWLPVALVLAACAFVVARRTNDPHGAG